MIEVGELVVDLPKREVRSDGEAGATSTPHQFDLLRVFALNVGKLRHPAAAPPEVWGPGTRRRKPAAGERLPVAPQDRAGSHASALPPDGDRRRLPSRRALLSALRKSSGRGRESSGALSAASLRPSSGGRRSTVAVFVAAFAVLFTFVWALGGSVGAVTHSGLRSRSPSSSTCSTRCSAGSGSGWAGHRRRSSVFAADPDRAELSARHLDGARLHARKGDVLERGLPPLPGRRRARLRVWRTDQDRPGSSTASRCVVFTIGFSVFLYGLLRLQGHLFLNPDHLPAVPWTVALNTTASFVTNTNWQYYAGEATMSYLSQMAGLAVQQFVSAGAGLAVLARGGARRRAPRRRRRARQLLARSLPLDRLHPAAALDRRSRSS